MPDPMLPPTAHTHDPETSHVAAELGKEIRRAQRAAVLAAVQNHPGLASSQLVELVDNRVPWADDPHEKLYQVRRRLSDLKHCSPPWITSYGQRNLTGRPESCWWTLLALEKFKASLLTKLEETK